MKGKQRRIHCGKRERQDLTPLQEVSHLNEKGSNRKGTADLNPILISQIDFTFKDDEETLKKLYGLM